MSRCPRHVGSLKLSLTMPSIIISYWPLRRREQKREIKGDLSPVSTSDSSSATGIPMFLLADIVEHDFYPIEGARVSVFSP